MSGKIIVFEGIDGSGKGTHSDILFSKLKRDKYLVEKIAFPQYGKKSAYQVEQYLKGNIEDTGVKEISKLYAEDRMCAKKGMNKWLSQDKIIIVDRYVASNMGHQGGKINDSNERHEFFNWLYELEYDYMKIPKPDLQLFLDVKPHLSLKLIEGDATREGKDIHEKNTQHLENAYNSYKDFIEFSNKKNDIFNIMECEIDGKMKEIEEVQKNILECVNSVIL